jgi:excisionase family DNA binding protein
VIIRLEVITQAVCAVVYYCKKQVYLYKISLFKMILKNISFFQTFLFTRHYNTSTLKKSIMEKKKFINVREAAEYLGLSRKTVYNLTSMKVIRFYKPTGGRLYFLQADLEQFVLGGRQGGLYE